MNRSIILLAVASLALFSCQKTSTDFVNKATNITLSVREKSISAGYAKVGVTLDDERVYYMCGITPAYNYIVKEDNSRFMQLCIDYEYVQYINWRYMFLEKDEPYIASFADHCLNYGNDDRAFSGLEPNTKYLVYAFCVNPDTMTPMGEMSYEYLTTTEIIKSDLTFKVRFDQKEDGPFITVMPSNDTEPYIWDYVETEETIREFGSIEAYAEQSIQMYKEMGLADALRVTGFATYNAQDYLQEGYKYTLIVSGYDSGRTTDFFTWEFEYPFVQEGVVLD